MLLRGARQYPDTRELREQSGNHVLFLSDVARRAGVRASDVDSYSTTLRAGPTVVLAHRDTLEMRDV